MSSREKLDRGVSARMAIATLEKLELIRRHLGDSLRLQAGVLRAPEAPILNTSDHLRHLVDREIRQWKSGPYFAVTAQHFLHVTANGDFFYHFNELLHLNHDNPSITTRIDMQHAKISDYLKESRNVDVANYLRSKWALHHFRLSDVEGNALADYKDLDGITTKAQTKIVPFAREHSVRREAIAHLVGYSQFQCNDSELHTDREGAQFDLRIPTGFLEVVVVVDWQLYRDTPKAKGRPADPSEDRPKALKGGLMTLESEGFPNHGPSALEPLLFKLGNSVSPKKRMESTNTKYNQAFARVLAVNEGAREFARQVREGTEYQVPSLPDAYFFYVLQANCLGQGERLTVSWPRSVKPM